ncbi:MAG: hypothetical protein JXR97_07380, partial [Planctomycetes bacterium]|nr:hypothetical protein [Planctomycetota bacterium]
MRIEFQFPVFDPPLGGVENYILEASAVLSGLDHECQVFCGPSMKECASPSLPVFRHSLTRPSGVKLL